MNHTSRFRTRLKQVGIAPQEGAEFSARLLRIRHICNDYLNALDAFYRHKIEGDHEYLYETLIKIRTILYERFAVELKELRTPLNKLIKKLYEEDKSDEIEESELESRKFFNKFDKRSSRFPLSLRRKRELLSAVKYRDSRIDRFERYFESLGMPLTKRGIVCFLDVVEIRPPVLEYLTTLDKIFSSKTNSKTCVGNYFIKIKVDFYADLIWHVRGARNPLDSLISKLRIAKEDAGGN